MTSPDGQLGGNLGAQLPWVFLASGIALTAAAAFIVRHLVRRRAAAETDAITIAGLYEQLDTLYGQQRTIAETLQHALLPLRNSQRRQPRHRDPLRGRSPRRRYRRGLV